MTARPLTVFVAPATRRALRGAAARAGLSWDAWVARAIAAQAERERQERKVEASCECCGVQLKPGPP